MEVQTSRFGKVSIEQDAILNIPHGMIGFPEQTQFCLLDPGEDILILWLQSVTEPMLAFPILEPRFFKADYRFKLSAAERRELELESVQAAAVFSVLTIPEDVSQMTANLKAPIVINLAKKTGKQVVLQENELNIRHPMFKELRAQLVLMESASKSASLHQPEGQVVPVVSVPIDSLHPTLMAGSPTV